MPGIGAPKTRAAVDDGAALRAEVMHVLGISEKTRALLERAVGGKRHPVSIEIVSQLRFSRGCGNHGRRPLKEGKLQSRIETRRFLEKGGHYCAGAAQRAGTAHLTELPRRPFSRAE